MRLTDLVSLSIASIVRNRARSVLTMLGIIIGMTSVILMVSVGQAAQLYLLSQIASFGSDLVFVTNGSGDEERGGPPSANIKQTLTQRDYERVSQQPWVKAASASIITRDLVSYAGTDTLTQITGATADPQIIFNDVIVTGRPIGIEDVDRRARVTVLGPKLANRLFGAEDPLGRTIKIAKQPFKVIGTLAPAGTRFFAEADDQAYVPFTAYFDLYHKDRLNFFAFKTDTVRPSEAKDLIRIVLRETHKIENPQNLLSKDDFRVATQEDAIKNADMIGSVLQILLGSIAGISLGVAGVGIMNIMYVTVTERTREIGLRKALGARPSDIMGQFLAEAVLLTVFAGIIGICCGVFFSWLAIQIILHFQAGWSFALPLTGMGISFSVSVAIGLIFGFFPARRAARLRPIEALGYE